MPEPISYANWWSRLLFQQAFERQFVIPVPPPRWTSWALAAAERTFFPASRVGATRVEKPVFVIGLPRSGTTMLFNLLASHEQAAYFTNSMAAYPRSLVAIEKVRRGLRANVRGERYLGDSLYAELGGPAELMTFWGRWTGRGVDDLDWEGHPVTVTAALAARVQQDFQRAQYAFGPQARRMILKDPLLQPDLLAVQAIFPDARFIHIVRDPRMVANSLVKLQRLNNAQIQRIRHPELSHMVVYPRVGRLQEYLATYGEESIETTARVWADAIELVRQAAPKLPNFLELRYEDMVAAPETHARTLFDFCELPWPVEDNADFRRELAGVGHIHHENRYGDFEEVERAVGATMARFGYLPAPAGT